MIRDDITQIILQHCNRITMKSYRGHRVKELRVIFTLIDPSGCTMFAPIVAFSKQKVIKVKLDNLSKIKLHYE
jgi:hypothetical protein